MSNRSQRWYFGPEQEQAVTDYISAKTKADRDRIYSSYLHQTFCALIEGILLDTRFKSLRGSTRDDIRADLTAKLWQALDTFNPERCKRAFSYFTAIVFNHIYTATSKKRHELQFDENLHTLADDYDTALEILQEHEARLEQIGAVVESLDDHERVVYEMYFTDSKTMRQIADHVGIPVGGVHAVVKTIRKKLRAEFGLDGQLPKLSYKKQKL